MVLRSNSRNTSVDIAKYIASIMIVAIHTGLFSDVGNILCFSVVNILCRTAVPMFAVCSGYFLARRLSFDTVLIKSKENLRVLFRQWKKLVILYGVWSVLYLVYSIPMWIETGWFSPMAFVDYAIGALTKGSHYHFWYLWGMIYTLPVFYLILRLLPRRFWFVSLAGLWLVKAATYGYAWMLPPFLSGIVNILQKADAFLCLLPLLLLGVIIASEKEKKLRFYVLGTCVSAFGLSVEAFILKSAGQESVSYILFTLPLAYFLFGLLLKIRVPGNGTMAKKLGAISLFVYCVHPMLVELTAESFPGSIVHFLFSATASTALGFACSFVKTTMKRKKVSACSN